MSYLSFFNDEPSAGGTDRAVDYLQFFDEAEASGAAATATSPDEPTAPVLVANKVNIIKELMNRGVLRQQAASRSIVVKGPKPRGPKPLRFKRLKAFSKGDQVQRSTWSVALHLMKARKKAYTSEASVINFLKTLEQHTRRSHRYQIKLFQRGRLLNKHGLLAVTKLRVLSKGNRFGGVISLSDFLRSAFGEQQNLKSLQGKRHRARVNAALALQVAPKTVDYLRCTVAGAVIAKQARLLAHVYAMPLVNR